MHNSASSLTSFIGRARELSELSTLLDDPVCRLLTLIGPGGIGKTRLALETAAHKQESFPDGIYIVPLAPLSQSDDILMTIAKATPFRFHDDERDPRQQFLDYLHEKRAKRTLLVLDNFEHLLDGADVVSDILAVTSHLKILATSREPLNLPEEWVRQITGMTYPDRLNGRPLDDYGAVQLFLDRARRIRGDFDLAEDSRSVLEICQLVEGMPLAIELAVRWLNALSPAEIAHEIRRSMDILTTQSRSLPERHRSIRSVFDHSWQLLAEDERRTFQKLSVFRGGFTREAARVVAGASIQALASLVDKSLVYLSAAGRYDVHELLRQYGAQQMDAAGETADVQRAYVEYYLGMLHHLECDIKGREQIRALDIIEADFENVRNAWQLAAQQGYFTALAQAAESLHFYADMRGHYHEVVTIMKAAVEQFPPTPDDEQTTALYRIQARLARLLLLGNLYIDLNLGDQITVWQEAARARQDQAEIAFCGLVGGIIAIWEASEALACGAAEALFQESADIYDALNDPFYKADALAWLGSCACYEDGGSDGIRIVEQSLSLRREIGDPNGIAWITLNLAQFMHMQLDYVKVEQYARQALALMRQNGSLKGVLHAIFKLAELAMLRGDLEEARTLCLEMAELADESNNLDGKMLAAGLLAFLISVMDENYAEGAALAHKNYVISLEPFFGTEDVEAHWGRAVAACGLGDYETMRQSYDSLCWARRDDPGPASVCLALEAVARAHDGEPEAAVEHLGLAFHLPALASGWLHRWPLLTRLRESLERQLGSNAFQAAWERGRQFELEPTIQALISKSGDSRGQSARQPLVEPLSERELEVLRLIGDGLSNRDIAERLYLSVGTVKVHTRNIYGKLNVNSRTQALAQAARFRLLNQRGIQPQA